MGGQKSFQTIAITGGKGGTGKSTLAVLWANQFVKGGKKVILVDLDVECPNDYLLLGQKLRRAKKFVFAKFPRLDKTKCQKCGECVRVCRSHAIFQNPGKYPIFLPKLCSACGACWITCPYQAIKIKKAATGRIFVQKVQNNFWLITGLAKAGLEETGPVVAEVKKFSLVFARKHKINYILFDTAAGTHCPVIQALLGVDLAYAVTEPTPMGAYDLKLILDLCQKLKVPVKVFLNQADLGDRERINSLAEKFGIGIEKEISYSKKIAEAYAKGKLLGFAI